MATVGPNRRLFLDDEEIRTCENVTRRRHRPEKAGVVLGPERPWEGRRVYCFGSVLEGDDGGYRMWYIARLGPGNGSRSPALVGPGDLVCYAVSDDGLAWRRPDLGLVPFDGSSATNILFSNGHCPSVVEVPDGPAEERFRMAVHGWDDAKGYTLRYSADGLRWRFYSESPMFGEGVRNEVMCVTRRPDTGRFYAYHRRWADNYKPQRRVIGAAYSDDYRHWSPARLVILPDDRDTGSAFHEPLGTEFYDMSGFWYESQFVGILPVFLVQSYQPELRGNGSNVSPWDGPIEAELVHSRDGLDWRRYDDRTPILPRGEEGEFDAGCILGCASAPVVLDDEIRLYYTGVSTTHGGPMPPKEISIGMATWRRDGFVSMAAGADTGVLETVAIEPGGSTLMVNAAAANGRVTVELLAADGRVIPGFSGVECRPIESDSTRHVVRWRGGREIDGGTAVRIRFTLTSAEIFSYWFE